MHSTVWNRLVRAGALVAIGAFGLATVAAAQPAPPPGGACGRGGGVGGLGAGDRSAGEAGAAAGTARAESLRELRSPAPGQPLTVRSRQRRAGLRRLLRFAGGRRRVLA